MLDDLREVSMTRIASRAALTAFASLAAVLLVATVLGLATLPQQAVAAQQEGEVMAAGEITLAAQEITNGDWRYVAQKGNTAKLVQYIGKSSTVTVPSKIGGRTVTAIGADAFYGYYYDDEGNEHSTGKVKSVWIPKTVKAIGEKESVDDVSDTGVVIKYKARSYQLGSEYLQSVSVSAKNPYFKSVGGVLFNKKGTKLLLYPNAKKGTSYTIPSKVKVIASRAFQSARVKKVVVSSSVRKIEPRAFSYGALQTVVFKPGIVNIGNYAFYCAEMLKSVSFPKSLRTIGKAAFAYTSCTSAKKAIVFNDGLTSIGEQAFYWPMDLKKHTVVIPKTVKKIGGGAFTEQLSVFKVPKETKLLATNGNPAIEAKEIVRY